MNISVTPLHSGVELSTIVRDELVRRLYIGYTLAEAKSLFREFVREQEGK